jgi:hypothetical protein
LSNTDKVSTSAQRVSLASPWVALSTVLNELEQ